MRACALILRGWTSSLTNHEADAAEMIAAGLAAYAATGGTAFSPFPLRLVAPMGMRPIRCRSEEHFRGAGHIERTNERWAEAEVHRTAGELIVTAGRTIKSGSAFSPQPGDRPATRCAIMELRAATSLAGCGAMQPPP